jgi:hypothetical protein
MGADYSIYKRKVYENPKEDEWIGEESSFYITRNYNRMFPFWMLHNHIEDCYESDKRKPFIPEEEYKFLLKTVRKTLQYYTKGNIYNHQYWEKKMKELPESKVRPSNAYWQVNKYTIILALIRYYWHLKRYPFKNFIWSCWY